MRIVAILIICINLILLSGCLNSSNPEISLTPPPNTIDPSAILTISSVTAESTDTEATIRWETNIESDRLVRYGVESGKYSMSNGERDYKTLHTISLVNLKPGTTYFYRVGGISPDGKASQSKEFIFSTDEIPPPFISDVSTVSDSTSAIIQWQTDVETSSFINYSNTPSSFNFSIKDEELKTSHEIFLRDLLPGNTYFYKIVSTNEKGVHTESEILSFHTNSIESGEVVNIGDLSIRIAGLAEYLHDNKFYSKADIEIENKAEEVISISGISTAVLSDDGNQSTQVNLRTSDEFTSLDLLLPKGTISRALYYERVSEGEGVLFISIFLPNERYSFKVKVDSPLWTSLNLTQEEVEEETKENIEVSLDEFTSRWERHSSGRSFLHARADFTFSNKGEVPVYLKLSPKPAVIDDEGIQHIYEKTGHKDEFKELTLFPSGQVSGAFFFSPHIGFHTKDIVLILYLNGIKYEYALNVYMR
ncbi:MAG: fibronectin type III domain-containing protein [Candidatus Sifarchaeia archaeon]